MLIPIQSLTPEWHAYRQGRITATDCSAILGAQSFKSPIEIWSRITGRAMPDREATAIMQWGNRTEGMHAAWFAEETNLMVAPWGGIEQHPDIPWLCSSPDYRLIDTARGNLDPGALELKAPSQWNRDDWGEDGVPLAYQIQLQIQYATSGARWGHASALVQPEIVHAPVPRSERFIDASLNKLNDWYEKHVVRDTPPPATAETAERQAKFLRDMGAAKEFRGAIQLSAMAIQAHEDLVELKAEAKALESKQKLLEARILGEMQNATYGVLDGGSCYRFRKAERNYRAQEARTIEITEFRYLTKLPADCAL